jgi:hypothetical protein
MARGGTKVQSHINSMHGVGPCYNEAISHVVWTREENTYTRAPPCHDAHARGFWE